MGQQTWRTTTREQTLQFEFAVATLVGVDRRDVRAILVLRVIQALGIIIKKDGDSLFEVTLRSGNLALVEALEEFLGKEVIVCDEHEMSTRT